MESGYHRVHLVNINQELPPLNRSFDCRLWFPWLLPSAHSVCVIGLANISLQTWLHHSCEHGCASIVSTSSSIENSVDADGLQRYPWDRLSPLFYSSAKSRQVKKKGGVAIVMTTVTQKKKAHNG